MSVVSVIKATLRCKTLTRILIVDNNGVEAWDIEECLIDAGYVASSAQDAASALRAAESARPDIVLIDTHLTGSILRCCRGPSAEVRLRSVGLEHKELR